MIELLQLGRSKSEDTFVGFVPSTDFITSATLRDELGIDFGVVMEDAGWLSVMLDGKHLFVAKKPLLNSVDEKVLTQRSLVTGDRTIEVRGATYKVRLLKTMNPNASSVHPAPSVTYDHVVLQNSEFNRIFYPLTYNSTHPIGSVSPEGLVFGSLAQYTEEELGFSTSGAATVNQLYTICQEKGQLGYPVERGFYGVHSAYSHHQYLGAYHTRTWRPVLEKV